MKPEKLDAATDYRLALLWLMDRLESARVSEAMAAFEKEFGDLIPAEHRETNDSSNIRWEHYVAWSRYVLVQAGLMGSGGRGVWTITPAGQEWLRENPRANHSDFAALIRRVGAKSESGFRWRGKQYTIGKQALLSRARHLLKEDPPTEALRFRDWAVFVGEQPVSVKWLFALATGADHNQFDSPTARRALSQVGIEARRVGESEKPAPTAVRRPRGADRVKRRDEFLAQLAELLTPQLSAQTSHGEIKLHPGRNWLWVDYAEFPRSHYELRLARGFDEVAFHLEGKRELNLARLAHLEPHIEKLSASLSYPVIAERWGSNWARVAIDLPTAPWSDQQAEEYAGLLARFIDATFPLLQEAFVAVPSRQRRQARSTQPPADSPDGQAHALLDQHVTQIRTFLQGRSSRPSDEVLCDWVQFCYTFELFDEGYELFNLIVHSAVNEWLYGRVRKLAQVCRIRAQNKG